jgi:two-component system CheB/CheR fusion protein
MLNDILSTRFDLRKIEKLLKIQHALDIYSIIAITDKNGTITYANNEFCRISKYSKEELIGQNHRILKSGFHPSEFYEGMWKTISSGKVWRGEIKNRAKDGSFYWVKTIIVPLLDESSEVVEYVSIRTDITNEKELYQRLVESTDKLVKAERLSTIGELASRLAHDLRNPLTTIKTEIELFKLKNKTNEDGLQLCSRVERAVNRINYQIEGVLNFVRSKSLNVEKSSIKKIIQSAISHVIIPDGVKIILHQEDAIVLCDVRQIEVAFENIITNAIQAIENIGTITISIINKDAFVDIQITDTGPGIPENIISKIFEPLFTTKQQGTGLGLASVKRIIEQHHGIISVNNNPTTFNIRLPKTPESIMESN